MKRYKVVQAQPGTDDYGWYVLVLGTDGVWYNFFGRSPLANAHQIDKVRRTVEAWGAEEVR